MTPGFADETELLSVLLRAEESAREALTATECDLIVEICSEIVAMAPGLPGDHPGRAARSAAELLLEMTVPGVDRTLRQELAHAVEIITVRRTTAA